MAALGLPDSFLFQRQKRPAMPVHPTLACVSSCGRCAEEGLDRVFNGGIGVGVE